MAVDEIAERLVRAAYGQIATEKSLSLLGIDSDGLPTHVPAHWRAEAERRAYPYVAAMATAPQSATEDDAVERAARASWDDDWENGPHDHRWDEMLRRAEREPGGWDREAVAEHRRTIRAALAAARAGEAQPGGDCPECGDGPGCRCGVDWTAAQRDHEAWAVRNIGVPPSERLAAQRGGEAVDREALDVEPIRFRSDEYMRRARNDGAWTIPDFQDDRISLLAEVDRLRAVLAARGDAAPTVTAEQRDRLAEHLANRLLLEPDDTWTWSGLSEGGRNTWRNEADRALAALGIEVRP